MFSKGFRSFIAAVCFLLGAIFAIVFTPSEPQRKIFEKEEEADAWGAFEWWYDQRALPYEFIPQGAFERASRYVKSTMMKGRKFFTNSAVSPWTSLGPTNIGGRVLAIAVNPSNTNIVWLGAASGGLWKSTSAGEGANPWSYMYTGFPSLSISAIAIDSTNPDVMYIGTGEISRYKRPLVGVVGARASYGLGILKSTDGGTTWDTTGLTYTFPEITAIQKIVINPRNTQTVYAATSEGVAKSTDAGTTWTMVNTEFMAMDLVINPVDTTILYSSHGNLNSTDNPGIYYTDDAGASWIRLGGGLPTSNFGRTSLSISPTTPSVIYAGVSHGSSGGLIGLYKTVNGGTNWSAVSTTNFVGSQGWYDNVVAVHPTNANNVYCSGLDIYRSTTGGTNLSYISPGVHVDHHATAFDPGNPSIMYFGCDGGIYKSEDGGESFSNLNNGFVTTQFYPGFVCAKDDSNFALGGLQDNGTLLYVGSSSWNTVFGGDGGWCAISSSNKYNILVESQYMNLARSTNGGASFTSATSGLPASGASNYNFIPPFVMSYSNPGVLYAGSRNVYKTTNGGTSWFAANGGNNTVGLNGTFISCFGISLTHHDTVMAGTGSGLAGGSPLFQIFSSTNGGAAWTNVTGALPDRYPTDIEFDPRNSTTAYVTYSGYGTPHVFKTTDIGATWTDISSNLPDLPHQAIIVDPEESSSIFVGTDLGVFHSSNGGESWEDFSTGMPQAMILDLTISRANAALRAATFGNGVYQRKLPRTPSLAVTSPGGGEILASGTSATITWSQKYLTAVKLEYSADNGTNWTTITNSVPVSPSQYSWLVPFVATSQGRIRISDATTGLYADTSSGTFTILLNPDIITGWNLLSVDLAPPDRRTSALFSSAISPAYTYDGNYIQRDTLLSGIGYWLKFDAPEFTSYGGDSITVDTVEVKAGWNMIGSISVPVSTASVVQIPPGIVTSSYFGYFMSYSDVTTIEPKHGYWVKTNANGKLVLQTSASPPQASAYHEQRSDFNSLTITDNAGKRQTLYFTGRELPPEKYELPPAPPPGIFDVRFSTQRMAECFESASEKEIPIIINSAVYPVKVEWRFFAHAGEASLIIDGKTLRISGNGETAIRASESGISLRLSPQDRPEVPAKFSLLQNYPNPFNPATTVKYQIGVTSRVSLKIFDMLGNEVAALAEEIKLPGEYAIRWDASALASGIYFSRLTADPFPATGGAGKVYSETRKMVLLK